MRVLLIEDDYLLGEAIRDHVAADGHGVDWMKRLDEARDALQAVDYELVLLDLNLPDGRGLDLLKEMRASRQEAPVIILTAQDQVAMRIEGLNSGADDYLVKPFDLSELTARLNAVARRYDREPVPAKVFGDVTVDIGRRQVARGGKPVELTAREWAVLERLARSPGIVISKEQLEDSIFPFGEEAESNAVEVYVSRLRKKLGKDTVQTIRGLGYRMVTQ